MLFPLCMNFSRRNIGLKPNFRVIIMEMVKSPKGFESSHNGKSFVVCWVFIRFNCKSWIYCQEDNTHLVGSSKVRFCSRKNLVYYESFFDEMFIKPHCLCQTSQVNLWKDECFQLTSVGVYLKSLNLIVYDLLNCNVRDIYFLNVKNKSINVGGIVHEWNYHKMTNWVPWKWNQSDMILDDP